MAGHLRRSASISKSDRLLFPFQLKYFQVDGRVVVLSPETANWLILDSCELPLLERLVRGDSVGSTASWAEDNFLFSQFKSLLAQIVARKFASTIERPAGFVERSLKGAYFYLTNACNLRCSHCYMYSGKSDKGELSVEEWMLQIDEFVRCGGANITFSGGEVLAKRGWHRVIEHASGKGISSTILTNGTLWTPSVIRKVARHVSEIQVSVDGPTEDINSMTRGDGAFQKAIETARLFAEHGVRTSIAMTPTPKTIKHFEEHFLLFFNKYIAGTGINVRIGHKLLSGREVSMLVDKEKVEFEFITTRLANAIYPSSALRSFAIGHQPNEAHPNCGFGGISISATGEVYPCNRTADVRSLGNVRSKKIGEILPSLLEAERATNVDSIVPCKYCDLRYICGGGCRIDDYQIFKEDGVQVSFKETAIREGDILRKVCTDRHKTSILRTMVEVKDYLFAEDE